MKKVLFFSVLILGLFLFGAVAGATTITLDEELLGTSTSSQPHQDIGIVDFTSGVPVMPTFTITIFTSSDSAVNSVLEITDIQISPPDGYTIVLGPTGSGSLSTTNGYTVTFAADPTSILAAPSPSFVRVQPGLFAVTKFASFSYPVYFTVIHPPAKAAVIDPSGTSYDSIASGPCDNLEIIHTIKASPVYDGASTDTDIIGRVEAQEEVHLAGWSDDYTWCKIFYKDCSRIGWVPRKVLGI